MWTRHVCMYWPPILQQIIPSHYLCVVFPQVCEKGGQKHNCLHFVVVVAVVVYQKKRSTSGHRDVCWMYFFFQVLRIEQKDASIEATPTESVLLVKLAC